MSDKPKRPRGRQPKYGNENMVRVTIFFTRKQRNAIKRRGGPDYVRKLVDEDNNSEIPFDGGPLPFDEEPMSEADTYGLPPAA